VISPPLDDSWSTYHRLYDQFEEKYGKLISAQQQNQSTSSKISSSNQLPIYSKIFQPSITEYDPSSHSSLFEYNQTIYTPTQRSSNQVGWKRKKGFKEPGRRILPPRLSLNDP